MKKAYLKIIRTIAVTFLLITAVFLNGFSFIIYTENVEVSVAPEIFEIPEIPDVEVEPQKNNEITSPYLNYGLKGVVMRPYEDYAPLGFDILSFAEKCEYISGIGLNTIILPTGYSYDVENMNVDGTGDGLGKIITAAKKHSLSVYIAFDLGREYFPSTESELHKLILKYPIDGIIFQNSPAKTSYSEYASSGYGGNYQEYLTERENYFFKTISNTVHITSSKIVAGTVSALGDYKGGFNETLLNYADFIIDDFKENIENIDEQSETKIVEYKTFDNSNLTTEDGLLRQLTIAKKDENYGGCVFKSYSAFSENVLNTTNTLKDFFSGDINEGTLFEELTMTSPDISEANITDVGGVVTIRYTTETPTVVFAGTFDENFSVTFDGQALKLNSVGNFYLNRDLEVGQNNFTIKHKSKTYNYQIERKVTVLKGAAEEVSYGRNLRVEGKTKISVSVVAYGGSKVTATLAGSKVTLAEKINSNLEGTGGNTGYAEYVGKFAAPAGKIGAEQSLGAIVINGSYQGYSETLTCASVVVVAEEPPKIIDTTKPIDIVEVPDGNFGNGEIVGVIPAELSENTETKIVTVKNDYTIVYDAASSGKTYNPNFGQLPAGAADYFKADLGEFISTVSGKRFDKNDVTVSDGYGFGDNAMSVVEQGTANGDYYLKFLPDKKITFNIYTSPVSYYEKNGSQYYVNNYSADTVYIVFDNLTSVTALPDFSSNVLFSSGKWEQISQTGATKFRLALTLRNKGIYRGCTAKYSGDTLMISFKNPDKSLSGMTIVIDPGHGYGKTADKFDPGAIGEVVEQTVNLEVSKYLTEILTAKGANVIRLKTESQFLITAERPDIARSYGADLFISLHSNYASNTDARGVEAYYYTPFSQQLAKMVSSSLAEYYKNNVYADGADKDRGDKWEIWYVCLHQDFPSILVELGFVSNEQDAYGLGTPTHQKGLAEAVAKGVENYLVR